MLSQKLGGVPQLPSQKLGGVPSSSVRSWEVSSLPSTRRRCFYEYPLLVPLVDVRCDSVGGQGAPGGAPGGTKKWTILGSRKAPKPFEFIVFLAIWPPQRGSICGPFWVPPFQELNNI